MTAKQAGLSADDIASLDALAAKLDSATYYELLGVAPQASRGEIRAAFFALSKRFHPDRFFRVDLGPRKAQLEQVFEGLNRAYETLSRGAIRSMYDAQLDEERRTDPVPRAVPEPAASAPSGAPTSPVPAPETPTKRVARVKKRPPAHVLARLTARKQAADRAENAQKNAPPAPTRETGEVAASALARELIRHNRRDDLKVRGHLREADLAEQDERWGDAYRALTLAHRLANGQAEVELLRRAERAHQCWMRQQAPANQQTAEVAESAGRHGEAALYWSRVADATDEFRAHLSAARNFLRLSTPHERAKAGRPARRAVELAPHDLKANKVLLDFFEKSGMDRSAERQRQAVARLKELECG